MSIKPHLKNNKHTAHSIPYRWLFCPYQLTYIYVKPLFATSITNQRFSILCTTARFKIPWQWLQARQQITSTSARNQLSRWFYRVDDWNERLEATMGIKM